MKKGQVEKDVGTFVIAGQQKGAAKMVLEIMGTACIQNDYDEDNLCGFDLVIAGYFKKRRQLCVVNRKENRQRKATSHEKKENQAKTFIDR